MERNKEEIKLKRKREKNSKKDKKTKKKKTKKEIQVTAFNELEHELSDEIEALNILPIHNDYSKWARPTVRPFDPSTTPLAIQLTTIDYTIGDSVKEIPAFINGKVPIIRIHGVTATGNSVLMNVYEFYPYLYIKSPWSGTTEEQLRTVIDAINYKLFSESKSKKEPDTALPIIAASLSEGNSIIGFTTDTIQFIKLYASSPRLIPSIRVALQDGIDIEGLDLTLFDTFESNIPFILRFMVDKNIVGGGWVEAKAGEYFIVSSSSKSSRSQIEINVSCDSIIGHDTDGEWSKIAPLRILSFDIECAGRIGVFPEPEYDPVIQIANHVKIHGEDKSSTSNIFTLKRCSPIYGSNVYSFDEERILLEQWREFISVYDPDIIIGHNIANFDFPYLINRAKAIRCAKFPYLGRLLDHPSKLKDAVFSSKAFGKRESKELNIDGTVIIDMLQVIQREHKLRSYTLNSVSAHFLGDQKEDVSHTEIPKLQNGTDEDRKRLAQYCLKDAALPLRLFDKLMIIYNYTEMARVTGIPIDFLLSKGQQVKVLSQLYRFALKKSLFIPYYQHSKSGGDNEEGYEGATVIDPMKGYYDEKIATLDFTSLYPSIMIDRNLCYSTLLTKDQLKLMNHDDYEQTPTGDYFVKRQKKKGILPLILEGLLSARKQAKKDMADAEKAGDYQKRAVMDGRQLALKISANSVYGFTGATIGKLPCLAISASVTAWGRKMIEFTKDFVEKTCTVANGYPCDAQVIYGDTDSVMIRLKVETVKESMEIGKKLSILATAEMRRIWQLLVGALEFEKIYYPYLLLGKKRYAGLFWTKPDRYDKLDAKGIETVRRDNCRLASLLVGESLTNLLIGEPLNTLLKQQAKTKEPLDQILNGKTVEQMLKETPFTKKIQNAIEHVKKTISDLLTDKIDISMLIITKALSKSADEYKNKQIHTELADRMRKRDPLTAPNTGDRVPYVMVKAHKKAKAYDKSEDPIYVLENDIPIDYEYYLENQLKKPLTRLFTPVMENPSSLFNGDHTKKRIIQTPKTGGIIQFAIRIPTCMKCKSKLEPGRKATCLACAESEVQLNIECLEAYREMEKKFSELWTQCQNCQGSVTNTIICSNRDCPIFYARKKASKNIEAASKKLERFDTSW